MTSSAGDEGDDDLDGGCGEDRFIFEFGDGNDLVLDFDEQSDIIMIPFGVDPVE